MKDLKNVLRELLIDVIFTTTKISLADPFDIVGMVPHHELADLKETNYHVGILIHFMNLPDIEIVFTDVETPQFTLKSISEKREIKMTVVSNEIENSDSCHYEIFGELEGEKPLKYIVCGSKTIEEIRDLVKPKGE